MPTVNKIIRINISATAEKNLEKVPAHIGLKLYTWVDAVHREGIEAIRRIPGYHDEPLKGPRQGERSIRLNKAYRAIYREMIEEGGRSILITEVTKHDY